MTEIAQIHERLKEIESKQNLIIDAILSLVKELKPDHKNFGLLALITGMTSYEVEEIEELFEWATFNSQNISKEDFTNKFKEKLPKAKDMLQAIVEAYKADEKYMAICEKLL